MLSAATTIGLIPFIILRISLYDWHNALFNMALFFAFVGNGLFTYKFGKAEITSVVFAILLVSAMLLGFLIKGTGQLQWSYPALVAIFFAVHPKIAAVFCTLCITLLAILSFPLMDTFAFTSYLVTICYTCFFAYVFANLTREQRRSLFRLATRDPLTDLRNRRAFDERIDEIIGLIRDNHQTCLILFDIDHFKNINDQHGHSIGDKVLYELGQLVSQRMRRTDRFYRIGGEEFAIILINTNCNDAIEVTDDIRSLVAHAEFVNDIKVTISLALSEYSENESKDSWYKRCDESLYRAKEAGRNNFKLAKPVEPNVELNTDLNPNHHQ